MATLNLQVEHGDRDAYEAANGTVTLDGVSIGAITTGGQWGGVSYPTAGIPKDATITSAILQTYISSTANDTPVADIYGETGSSPAIKFSATSNNISSRPQTTAKASVNASNVGTGWYSVDVTSVVQELVNQSFWTPSYPVILIIDGLSGISWGFRSYEFDPALAAKLDVTYTLPTSGQPPRTMHQFTQRRGWR